MYFLNGGQQTFLFYELGKEALIGKRKEGEGLHLKVKGVALTQRIVKNPANFYNITGQLLYNFSFLAMGGL